jgi:hypothetical protein
MMPLGNLLTINKEKIMATQERIIKHKLSLLESKVVICFVSLYRVLQKQHGVTWQKQIPIEP